ncbi:MAG TPA: serine hydrolase domain-containing protein [Herpetosiphonaceae bacterium]
MTDHPALRAILEAAWQGGAAPGLAASVRRDGAPLLHAAAGFADWERAQPLDADAPMYAYSVTKTLLAALALQFVEAGRITLETPVRAILAEAADLPIFTVRQLLNHTAGLPDYGALPAYAAALREHPGRAWDAGEFLARTLGAAPPIEPGARWAYSNIGYLLVRLMIERLAGAPLAAVVAERLAAPLGLRHTRLAADLADAAGLAPGFSAQLDPAGRVADIAASYDPGWVAHGTVRTTADELCLLLAALGDGTLLAPASWAAMREPVPVPVTHPRFRQPAYGLGLMIDAAPGGAVGHGGGGPGYGAGAIQLTAGDGASITSAVLANHDADEAALLLAFDLAQAAANLPAAR